LVRLFDPGGEIVAFIGAANGSILTSLMVARYDETAVGQVKWEMPHAAVVPLVAPVATQGVRRAYFGTPFTMHREERSIAKNAKLAKRRQVN
jgi:hypothetical protein